MPVITVTGTIRPLFSLWSIVTDQGLIIQLLPTVPAELQTDGLRVTLTGAQIFGPHIVHVYPLMRPISFFVID